MSLDRGVEVLNYLQTIGSDWSGSSVGSTWTVHSYGPESVQRYRSVEDIPASQYRVRSRRASSDFDSVFGRNLALSVLRDSYRGIDMGSGSMSPQIKKLKWSYSFTKSFDDFKDTNDTEVLRTRKTIFLESKRPYSIYKTGSVGSSRSNVSSDVEDYREMRSKSPQIKKLNKNISLRNLVHHKRARIDVKSESDDSEVESYKPYFKDISLRPRKASRGHSDKGLETSNLPILVKHLKSLKTPLENASELNSRKNAELVKRRSFNRSISVETGKTNKDNEAECKCSPQRKLGMSSHMSFVGVKKLDTSLRKEVLIRQNMSNFHSCEDILTSSHKKTRRRSIEIKTDIGFASVKDSSKREFSSDIQLLKKSVPLRAKAVSTNTVMDTQRLQATSVAKCININHTNTSNLVEISRNCDCRICTEEDREDRKSLIRRILNKLFMKIISCRDYGRKLTYWDDNNNLNENEMYACIMHILKLMLGLWLRHLDHN